jgi:hypothetical protein
MEKMATEFCQRCKQSHPGRLCDYDDKGECSETLDTNNGIDGEAQRPEEQTGQTREISG